MPVAKGSSFSDAEIDTLFAAIADRETIGLAVSGGADSLALMLLVRQWQTARSRPVRVSVFTIDHRLRTNSGAEASMVVARAQELGFEHRVLVWRGSKPTTGVEEAARDERYRLLEVAAMEAGLSDILTAHHREDQVETVLMRIGRGSGLSGLRGMRPARPLGESITVHRPMLMVPQERLRALVAAEGWKPAEDGSNADEAFMRPRLRRVMPTLAAAGIDSGQIARSAARLGRADDALDHYTELLLGNAVKSDAFAVVTLSRSSYAAAPVEVRHRALGRVLKAVGGRDWPPPRGDRLEALDRVLTEGESFKRTLARTQIGVSGELATIQRECGRVPLPVFPVSAGDSGIWDGRFDFRVEKGPQTGLQIGPLGRDVLGVGPFDKLPRGVAASLPVLRMEGEVVAAQGANLRTEFGVVASFRSIVDRSI
jgi:tRNA(Ile)-lysidine synthase